MTKAKMLPCPACGITGIHACLGESILESKAYSEGVQELVRTGSVAYVLSREGVEIIEHKIRGNRADMWIMDDVITNSKKQVTSLEYFKKYNKDVFFSSESTAPITNLTYADLVKMGKELDESPVPTDDRKIGGWYS